MSDRLDLAAITRRAHAWAREIIKQDRREGHHLAAGKWIDGPARSYSEALRLGLRDAWRDALAVRGARRDVAEIERRRASMSPAEDERDKAEIAADIAECGLSSLVIEPHRIAAARVRLARANAGVEAERLFLPIAAE